MRLVDADALMRCFGRTYGKPLLSGAEIRMKIKEQPTVEATPPIPAHWISTEKETDENTWECSECGWELFLSNDDTPRENGYNYCPNCGAVMDEVTE